jgi:murein DD-endopeptidase MepM/ murein hydrolase activator NlpD
MATLTGPQVAAYARAAGFSGEALVIALAIAKGESGWRTDAVGDVLLQTAEWGPSIGLWQIRSRKAETGTGGTRDANRLTDPAHNARSAYTLSAGGRSWTPWTVYNTGAYRSHLAAARAAVGAAAPPSGGSGIVSTTLTHPLPGATLTSPYGAPRTGGAAHTGADFAYGSGTCGRRVLAAAAGVATRRENAGGGHGVEIDHGGGILTGYWHLSSQVIASGQRVAAGQLIGLAGASGTMVSGCHLHFELKVGGVNRDPVPAIGGTVSAVPQTRFGELKPEAPAGTYPDVIGSGGGRCDVANGWRDMSALETAIRPELEGYCGKVDPGEVVGDIAGAAAWAVIEGLAPILTNLAVIGLALIIGWAGVKQVLGIGLARA